MTSPARPRWTARAGARRALLAACAVLVAGALLAGGLLLGGLAHWASPGGHSSRVAATAASAPVPDPGLGVAAPAGPQAAAPWQAPLELHALDGTLAAVTVLDPDGQPFAGTLVDATTWRSTAPSLLPAATYRVTASVRDGAGRPRPLTLAVRTTPAARILHATLSPGDGDVVGIGQPVVITLNHPVTSAADRAAIEQRLTVTTVPAVAGAWRWMQDNELHYRGPSYWAAGTTLRVVADLHRLMLADGTWGSGRRTTAYRIGDALISTVDVTAHVMTVRRNGRVLRVAKVSTGRDKYPTKGGVHLVLEKTRLKIMDSATVGIPRSSPDGYFEKVPFSVRISYGGAFVHSADWSVRDQGVRNVSHGCVNMSPADAEWFFGIVRRGDVVDVIHASAKPVLYDPGMSDWNIPFSAWPN